MTKLLKLSFLLTLSILFFTACEKDEQDLVTDSENEFYLNADEDEMADALVMPVAADLDAARTSFSGEEAHRFHGDCFTLVFPVDIAFPDGTTATVADPQDLRQTVRTWVANGGVIRRDNRPMLVFPLDVQLADGTIETLADRSGIRTLLAECRPEVERCATLVFPVTFDFNGTSQTLADPAAVRAAFGDYRANNPGAPRPTLVFPINIENVDGDTVSVASLAELRRIQFECRSDRRNDRRDCYTFNYPITLVNRAGRTIEVNTPGQLRRALSQANTRGQFVFQYPFDVTLESGREVTIDGPAAFRTLRQSCR